MTAAQVTGDSAAGKHCDKKWQPLEMPRFETKWWPEFASSKWPDFELKGEASFWSKCEARKSNAAASRESLSEVCPDGEQLQIVS